MSRTGSGAHHGGRDYRLNWKSTADGEWVFGDYIISGRAYAQSSRPWMIVFRGEPLLRAHGKFTGYRRFATDENAKRWVERKCFRPSHRSRV